MLFRYVIETVFIALVFVALVALMLTPSRAASCMPRDLACELMAKQPAKAEAKVVKRRPASIKSARSSAAQANKKAASKKEFSELIGVYGKGNAASEVDEEAFIKAIAENFEAMPVEWKRIACQTYYPLGVRKGLLSSREISHLLNLCTELAKSEAVTAGF